MSDSGAADEIARMKRELGVELDRDLAENLGLDPTAVSAWRRRGKVPAKYLLQHRRRIDEWSSTSAVTNVGSFPTHTDLRTAYLYALIAKAARLLPDQIETASGDYADVWIGFRLEKLHRYLSANIKRIDDKDGLRAEYERLGDEIEEADLPVWIETLT